MRERRKILVNKAQCNNCEDIIESKFRHDFVTCSCGMISIDGGLDYLKRSFNLGSSGYTDMSEYEESE